jgi:hypothetical protein
MFSIVNQLGTSPFLDIYRTYPFSCLLRSANLAAFGLVPVSGTSWKGLDIHGNSWKCGSDTFSKEQFEWCTNIFLFGNHFQRIPYSAWYNFYSYLDILSYFIIFYHIWSYLIIFDQYHHVAG